MLDRINPHEQERRLMVHVTLPKFPIRSASWRTRGESAASPASAHTTRHESLAAPLTLAAVVVLALMLAVTTALVTALGA